MSAPGGGRTVGVEEELLLVDPASGRALPVAGDLVSDPRAAGQLQGEFKAEQLEIASRPCSTMRELGDDLADRRADVAQLAAAHGVAVAASGTYPDELQPTAVRNGRFDRIEREFTALSTGQLTCGAHVHVGVTSRDEGVAALDGIRPWLSILTALTSSSPFWQGRDTGYASYRSVVLSQLPTAGPTPPWGDVDTYDRTTAEVIATGAAFDLAMIYYDARLSARYPTVEIRVADVCPTVEEAVLLAALCRGLVDTAVTVWSRGEAPVGPSVSVLRGAAWRAARHGMTGDLYVPGGGRPVPAWAAVEALVSHVREALERGRDLERVRAALEEVRRLGTGAQRQRAAFAQTGSFPRVLSGLSLTCC